MEAGTLIVRVELGTGSHRADQGCTAGLIVEMQGSSEGGADGIAGFSGASRRGSLGVETDLLMDRDGGDKDNIVLDRTSGDEDNTALVWVGSTTSAFQSISHSSSYSSTKIPTSTDVMASSHISSDGTSGFASLLGRTRLLALAPWWVLAQARCPRRT